MSHRWRLSPWKNFWPLILTIDRRWPSWCWPTQGSIWAKPWKRVANYQRPPAPAPWTWTLWKRLPFWAPRASAVPGLAQPARRSPQKLRKCSKKQPLKSERRGGRGQKGFQNIIWPLLSIDLSLENLLYVDLDKLYFLAWVLTFDHRNNLVY